jgi:hypothetical protein
LEVAMTKAEAAGLKALAANRYWSEAEGRAALDALSSSGLSMAAFSRETGITARRLAWWRRRTAIEPAGKIEFVPVEVARPARAASDGVMEVAIGDVRIRVGPGFEADALRRLLAVVAEPAC